MRIDKIYAESRKAVISFEVFPPKTDEAYESLLGVLPQLVDLRPHFMTVTYGALGSTQARTLEIASLIQDRFGLPVACHLTCVGSSRTELSQIIRDIHEAGIRNIVALRGDPPRGESQFVPPADGLAHGNELIAHIRQQEKEEKLGPFGIAAAGYPEKHIEAPDLATDLAHLKRKVHAGADCVITQLFYDNAHFYRFVESARDFGITVPIIPGLLPILSTKQIVRITSLCGSALPSQLRSELEAVEHEPEKAQEIGIRQCVAQAKNLIDSGVRGIHFYVLNKSAHMIRIMSKLPR